LVSHKRSFIIALPARRAPYETSHRFEISLDQALRIFSSIVSRRADDCDIPAIGWGRPTGTLHARRKIQRLANLAAPSFDTFGPAGQMSPAPDRQRHTPIAADADALQIRYERLVDLEFCRRAKLQTTATNIRVPKSFHRDAVPRAPSGDAGSKPGRSFYHTPSVISSSSRTGASPVSSSTDVPTRRDRHGGTGLA